MLRRLSASQLLKLQVAHIILLLGMLLICTLLGAPQLVADSHDRCFCTPLNAY